MYNSSILRGNALLHQRLVGVTTKVRPLNEGNLWGGGGESKSETVVPPTVSRRSVRIGTPSSLSPLVRTGW